LSYSFEDPSKGSKDPASSPLKEPFGKLRREAIKHERGLGYALRSLRGNYNEAPVLPSLLWSYYYSNYNNALGEDLALHYLPILPSRSSNEPKNEKKKK